MAQENENAFEAALAIEKDLNVEFTCNSRCHGGNLNENCVNCL